MELQSGHNIILDAGNMARLLSKSGTMRRALLPLRRHPVEPAQNLWKAYETVRVAAAHFAHEIAQHDYATVSWANNTKLPTCASGILPVSQSPPVHLFMLLFGFTPLLLICFHLTDRTGLTGRDAFRVLRRNAGARRPCNFAYLPSCSCSAHLGSGPFLPLLWARFG